MNIYFTLAVSAIVSISTWEVHTWYDGYKTKNQAIVAEQRAANGESKIITDTQNIRKDLNNGKKDDCLKQPIPPSVLKQLH